MRSWESRVNLKVRPQAGLGDPSLYFSYHLSLFTLQETKVWVDRDQFIHYCIPNSGEYGKEYLLMREWTSKKREVLSTPSHISESSHWGLICPPTLPLPGTSRSSGCGHSPKNWLKPQSVFTFPSVFSWGCHPESTNLNEAKSRRLPVDEGLASQK